MNPDNKMKIFYSGGGQGPESIPEAVLVDPNIMISYARLLDSNLKLNRWLFLTGQLQNAEKDEV